MPIRKTQPQQTHLLGELERVVEAMPRDLAIAARIVAIEPPPTATGKRADAAIELAVDTRPYRYAVEAKPRIDRTQLLPTLKAQLEALGQPALLFTTYMTPTLAEHCRKIDLQFLDTVGNVYLRAPGLYLFITGQKPTERIAAKVTPQGGANATALRVTFALLNNRDLLNATQRDIAQVAHVALGAVGKILADLEARGYIAGGTEKQNRRLLEPTRLFDEWVTNYPIGLRPKLNPRRFRAPANDWWRNAQLEHGKCWWGGEVAADRLTDYLKPTNCTIYFDPATRAQGLNQLVRQHRLRADLNGDIEVLDAFWKLPLDPQRPDIAPAMLVYADLQATLNPRNLEVAKLIREQFVDDALRTP